MYTNPDRTNADPWSEKYLVFVVPRTLCLCQSRKARLLIAKKRLLVGTITTISGATSEQERILTPSKKTARMELNCKCIGLRTSTYTISQSSQGQGATASNGRLPFIFVRWTVFYRKGCELQNYDFLEVSDGVNFLKAPFNCIADGKWSYWDLYEFQLLFRRLHSVIRSCWLEAADYRYIA